MAQHALNALAKIDTSLAAKGRIRKSYFTSTLIFEDLVLGKVRAVHGKDPQTQHLM